MFKKICHIKRHFKVNENDRNRFTSVHDVWSLKKIFYDNSKNITKLKKNVLYKILSVSGFCRYTRE